MKTRVQSFPAKAIVASTGALIVLAALLAYPLGLSATKGVSFGKVLLLLAGAALLAGALLGKRLKRAYETVSIMLLTSCVLLVLFEGSLLAVARVKGLLSPESAGVPGEPAFADGRPEHLSYYKTQPWARDYLKEYEEAWLNRPLRYQPYVTWRNLPYRGKTINISQEGRRVVPGGRCIAGEAYEIFMFGGSTMWGTGVPDWGTIPAHLQADLTALSRRPICVSNLSEQAYVSTQSVIQLLRELQEGRIPDLVIFYDGINDVLAAYQSGAAGAHHNLDEIAARFERRESDSALVSLVSRTRTYRLARRLASWARAGRKPPSSPIPSAELSDLAAEVAGVYANNARIVAALGEEFGFSHYFFWQPALLVDRKSLTTEEEAMKSLALSVFPGIGTFFRQTYRQVEELAEKNVRIQVLADAFADQTGLTYVDPWHVTHDGNRLIARAMLPFVKSELDAAAGGESSLVERE